MDEDAGTDDWLLGSILEEEADMFIGWDDDIFEDEDEEEDDRSSGIVDIRWALDNMVGYILFEGRKDALEVVGFAFIVVG